MSQYGQINFAILTKIRIIDALLDMWADAPADAVSVRALVHRAGAAQAAIHYHFGDMERLYAEASTLALGLARDWMETRLGQISVLAGVQLPTTLQASLLAGTIADWTTQQRRLAMASRYAPSEAWQAASDDFWTRFAGLLGLGEHAGAIACFGAGEAARHLLVWNPALDRALLEETAASLLRWLNHRQFALDAIRPIHQELARRGYDRPATSDDALAARIEQAAADLLAEKGHSGVTFRAVAAHAGVTLGKVIHLCGTKSELLRRALHRLYEREALGGDREQFVAQSFPARVMLDYLLAAITSGAQPVLRAYDEIERAIYNGHEYAALRGVVRSMEDPSGVWALEQMLAGRKPSGSLVAAFSAVIRGVGYQARFKMLDRKFESEAHSLLSSFLYLDG
jgi:AcrR family transcriptional regulator